MQEQFFYKLKSVENLKRGNSKKVLYESIKERNLTASYSAVTGVKR